MNVTIKSLTLSRGMLPCCLVVLDTIRNAHYRGRRQYLDEKHINWRTGLSHAPTRSSARPGVYLLQNEADQSACGPMPADSLRTGQRVTSHSIVLQGACGQILAGAYGLDSRNTMTSRYLSRELPRNACRWISKQ